MASTDGTLMEHPDTMPTVDVAPPVVTPAVTTPEHAAAATHPTPREHRNRVLGWTIAIAVAVIAAAAAVYFAMIAPVATANLHMGLSDEAWAQYRAGERATSVVVVPPPAAAVGVPHGAVPAELLD